MKKLILLITLIAFCVNHAQIKKPTEKLNTKTIKAQNFRPANKKLDLEILKKDLETQNRFYDVTIATASLLKSYKTTFPMAGYAIEQGIFWEEGSTGYFRTNARIKRSKTFTQDNHFEVLIYPTLRDKSKVGRVKITWRSRELGLNTFYLENANVVYTTQGILINGTKTIKEQPIGVTIVICSKKQ